MSEIKVNNIQSLSGTNGPVISGTVEMDSTGAMSLPRGDTTYRGGRGRGVFGGGRTSPAGLRDTVDYFTIATLGNAIDFGNLTTSTSEFGGCASSTRGIFMGGETFPTNINVIQYITISATGNTFDFGDLTLARRGTSCLSDNTRGICTGGSIAPTLTNFDTIDYVTIATTGNASDFGSLVSKNIYAGNCASSTRGIIAGGVPVYSSPYPETNVIQYLTIATTGNTQEFGDLNNKVDGAVSASNSTRGLFFGGSDGASSDPGFVTAIDYITIASLGDAIDFGDCNNGAYLSGAASSPTRAIFGDMTADANVISYVTIMTTGNAQDFGDLTVARNQTAACSDSHGGLG
jgi:hypothetical protein